MADISRSCDLTRYRITRKGNLMDYIIRSCDPLKVKIAGGIGAYVSKSCDLPKKEILMAYISRSCDLLKVKMGFVA